MITNDQIYSAITGFNPAKLQPLTITPSGSTQVFDESDLTDGNIGFCPVTVSAAGVGDFLVVAPDTTGLVVDDNTAQITIPDGVKAYSCNMRDKTMSPVLGTLDLSYYLNGQFGIDNNHALVIDLTSLRSVPVGTDIVVTYRNATPSGSYKYLQITRPQGCPFMMVESKSASATTNSVYYARVLS